jgi:hypothetical protein
LIDLLKHVNKRALAHRKESFAGTVAIGLMVSEIQAAANLRQA